MLTRYQQRILIGVPVFGLVVGAPVEVLHFMLEMLHQLFEMLEFLLDELIHHTLHTSTHTTQIIVFYLLMALMAYGVYRLSRVLRAVYSHAKFMLPLWWGAQKEKSVFIFKSLPLAVRVQMLCGLSFGFVILAMTVF